MERCIGDYMSACFESNQHSRFHLLQFILILGVVLYTLNVVRCTLYVYTHYFVFSLLVRSTEDRSCFYCAFGCSGNNIFTGIFRLLLHGYYAPQTSVDVFPCLFTIFTIISFAFSCCLFVVPTAEC